MNQVGVFAKYWQAGSVKTRLAASIGNVMAADLYRCFVEETIRIVDRSRCDIRTLVFSPPEQRASMAAIVDPSWGLWPQSDGSLGRRMSHFFFDAFRNGAEKVILVGSDTPSLPSARLAQAFRRLDRADVVLGPSDDGGYYLIGMKQPQPQLFQAIEWSTERVFDQTRAVIQRAGLLLAPLAPWYDVDRLDDLHRLQNDLQSLQQSDATNLIDRIDAALRGLK